jgi:hypothetical protein
MEPVRSNVEMKVPVVERPAKPADDSVALERS